MKNIPTQDIFILLQNNFIQKHDKQFEHKETMLAKLPFSSSCSPQHADFTTLNSNMASVWVKMASSWCCLGLYLWSMVAPIVMPGRDFS